MFAFEPLQQEVQVRCSLGCSFYQAQRQTLARRELLLSELGAEVPADRLLSSAELLLVLVLSCETSISLLSPPSSHQTKNHAR